VAAPQPQVVQQPQGQSTASSGVNTPATDVL
jgi:hypothetical protein